MNLVGAFRETPLPVNIKISHSYLNSAMPDFGKSSKALSAKSLGSSSEKQTQSKVAHHPPQTTLES
jgi:hypothetical protein